jgi:hypothetical protein
MTWRIIQTALMAMVFLAASARANSGPRAQDAAAALHSGAVVAALGGDRTGPAGADPVAAAAEPAAPAANGNAEEDALYRLEPLSRVRVAVLNASGQPRESQKMAGLLGDYRRRALEDKLGLKIELVNIAVADTPVRAPVTLYYRPGFLRAALLMAQAIPGNNVVAPMRPENLKRAGIDVEIVVGTEQP